jgi:hypothetical protein
MSKQELKLQYKTGKISTKEYFLALGKIIRDEQPKDLFREAPKMVNDDLLKIFDGGLPLYNEPKPSYR